MLIDTHCHLCHDDFAEDWHDSMLSAIEGGVDTVINVGFDIESSKKAIRQAKEWNGRNGANIYASAGLHPHDAGKLDAHSTDEQLSRTAEDSSVVAIGETGLDFFRDYAPVEKQEDAFRLHIRLAMRTALPLIIHNRESVPRLIEILKEASSNIVGVFHCFSGSVDEARIVLEQGFYIGITGNVTFANAESIRDVARFVPKDRLLVETDSPWLSPHPLRGRRNGPCNVRLVAEAVAQSRGTTLSEIASVTSENATRLFKLPATVKDCPDGAMSDSHRQGSVPAEP